MAGYRGSSFFPLAAALGIAYAVIWLAQQWQARSNQ